MRYLQSCIRMKARLFDNKGFMNIVGYSVFRSKMMKGLSLLCPPAHKLPLHRIPL